MTERTTSLEYFEFDFKGKRHHTIELPVPWWLKLARLVRFSPCRTYGCDDHGEIFCRTHGETMESNLEPEMRRFVHRVIKEGKFAP